MQSGIVITFLWQVLGAAPAREPRKLASGTPRGTVRSNYVGLPSMAGRGPDERGRKPAGSGRSNEPRPGPEARSRGAKSPQRSVERRAPSVIGRAPSGRFASTCANCPYGVDGYV